MLRSEAWCTVDYGTDCILGGFAVYAGSSGPDRLCRVSDMLIIGNGQLIFAIEFGTGEYLLFETAKFVMFTARVH